MLSAQDLISADYAQVIYDHLQGGTANGHLIGTVSGSFEAEVLFDVLTAGTIVAPPVALAMQGLSTALDVVGTNGSFAISFDVSDLLGLTQDSQDGYVTVFLSAGLELVNYSDPVDSLFDAPFELEISLGTAGVESGATEPDLDSIVLSSLNVNYAGTKSSVQLTTQSINVDQKISIRPLSPDSWYPSLGLEALDFNWNFLSFDIRQEFLWSVIDTTAFGYLGDFFRGTIEDAIGTSLPNSSTATSMGDIVRTFFDDVTFGIIRDADSEASSGLLFPTNGGFDVNGDAVRDNYFPVYLGSQPPTDITNGTWFLATARVENTGVAHDSYFVRVNDIPEEWHIEANDGFVQDAKYDLSIPAGSTGITSWIIGAEPTADDVDVTFYLYHDGFFSNRFLGAQTVRLRGDVSDFRTGAIDVTSNVNSGGRTFLSQLHSLSDTDYLKFTAAVTGTSTVTLDPYTSWLDVTGGVYDANGVLLAGAFNAGNSGQSESLSFNATAGSTYYIRIESGDYASGGDIRDYLYSVYVTSTVAVYTITAASGSNGSINPSGPVFVALGASKQFDASPSTGYVVDAWYYNNPSTPAQVGGTSFTATNVQSNGWVQVVFKQAPVAGSLSVVAPTGGGYSLDSHLQIIWDSEDLSGDLQIDLLRNGSFVRTIDDSIPVHYGSKRWRIPDTLPLGSGYQVRISSLAASPMATSASFSLLPEALDDQPIPINTYAKLAKIGSGQTIDGFEYADDAYYYLANDIPAGGATITPLPEFDGILDGRGYFIRDLNIGSETAEYVGLFSEISEGIVKNLNLQVEDVEGQYKVGAIAGENRGQIINTHVYVDGRIKGRIGTGAGQDNGFVGGIAGDNNGTISNSSVQKYGGGLGEIIDGDRLATGGIVGDNGHSGVIQWSFFNGEMSGNDRNGGIAGENHGLITESYVSGIVVGDLETGGLVGRAVTGTVSNSYVDAAVSGRLDSGGLIGINGGELNNSYFAGVLGNSTRPRNGALAGENNDSIFDSFWDAELTSTWIVGPDGSGGTVINSHGLPTEELYQQATYTTAYSTYWDFANIWSIEEDIDYPRLLGARASFLAGPSTVVASDDLPGRVGVTWSSVEDAGAYFVYRSDSADSARVELGFSTGTSYEDTTAAIDTTYLYYVTAAYTANKAGESDLDQAASDTGRSVFQADSPLNVTASTDLADRVLIQWDPVAGASYYQVHRANSENGPPTPISTWIASTTYFDATTTLGQDYYYWVTAAVDASGTSESEYSAYAIGSEGNAEIRLSVTSLDFGRQNIGQSLPKTITIFNDGVVDLIVYEISGFASPFEVFPINSVGSGDDWTISAGSSRDFTVVFIPTEGGLSSDQLSFATNDPFTPLVTLDVQGTGNFAPTVTIDSLSPKYAFSTDTVSFMSTGVDVDSALPLDYEWFSSLDGLIGVSEDFSLPAATLSLGNHEIVLRVTDNEGMPSNWVSTSLVVSQFSADFDFDGDVDGRDFITWQRGYGTNNADKADGDANNDQNVDGDDHLEWQATYGVTNTVPFDIIVSSTNVSVPEDGMTYFTVQLSQAPSHPITVSITKLTGDDDIFVSFYDPLLFDSTNWDSPQIVEVGAVSDNDTVAGVAEFAVSAPGATNMPLVTIVEQERDVWFFDFGTATSPVATGHIRITPNTLYDPLVGYGWVDSAPLAEDHQTGDLRERDLNSINASAPEPIVFAVDLSFGFYDIRRGIGHPLYGLDFVQVTYSSDLMYGTQEMVFTPPGGYPLGGALDLQAAGQLRITIEDLGGSNNHASIAWLQISHAPSFLTSYLSDEFSDSTSATSEPLSAELVDLALAVEPTQKAKIGSQSIQSILEEATLDRSAPRADWRPALTGQYTRAPYRSLSDEDTLYFPAEDDDAVDEEVLDKLFADEELVVGGEW